VKALVGGTNLLLMPEMQIAMTSLHFLSPDSKCQAFDHKANGYSRGEGAAVITLKPLADAIRDNNVIRAVIRGTGVNQDGKTPGITLPSAEAQEELIRTTYQSAGLDFSETNYFEAHGTGMASFRQVLKVVFRADRQTKVPPLVIHWKLLRLELHSERPDPRITQFQSVRSRLISVTWRARVAWLA
jgi:3-oxoacyl-(acyl-carrier-protein) synthase